MNHFFALEVPPDIRQQVAEHSRRWRELLGPEFPARWYEPEDYHITLKFLGDVPDEKQAGLIAATVPVAKESTPLRMPMASAGVLPHPRFVNVLIRFLRSSEQLLSLYKRMEAAVLPLGFPQDVKQYYVPHITVARCTRRPRTEVPILNITHEQMLEDFGVEHIVLMRTTPPEERQKSRPVRYNTVQTFPLGDMHS